MKDTYIAYEPPLFQTVLVKAKEIGFEMAADDKTGSLLRTLVASKPASRILELGTGIGAALCWIIEGLDSNSSVLSVDNDPNLIREVKDLLPDDPRVQLICQDGDQWIQENLEAKFDLIFADAWPGKYHQASAVLDMLNPGGIYVVDDMKPQTNWPAGHEKHVHTLLHYLHSRTDLTVTSLNWSTGIVLATKLGVTL